MVICMLLLIFYCTWISHSLTFFLIYCHASRSTSLVSMIAQRVLCLRGIKSTRQQRCVCVCFCPLSPSEADDVFVMSTLKFKYHCLSQVQRLLNIAPSGRRGSGVAMQQQQQMLNQQGSGIGGREPAVGRFLLPIAECSFTLESILDVGWSSLAAADGGIPWSRQNLSFKCTVTFSGFAKGSMACPLWFPCGEVRENVPILRIISRQYMWRT